MPIAYKELQPGDVVTYSDMANRERTYYILETPNEDHPFDFKMIEVVSADDLSGVYWQFGLKRPHYSDCRQHGWNLVKKAEPSI